MRDDLRSCQFLCLVSCKSLRYPTVNVQIPPGIQNLHLYFNLIGEQQDRTATRPAGQHGIARLRYTSSGCGPAQSPMRLVPGCPLSRS